MKSGPEMSLKAQFILASACTALFVWVLPAINAWIVTHVPPMVHARAQQSSSDTELARRYAAILAACFNGENITDGALIVECRRK